MAADISGLGGDCPVTIGRAPSKLPQKGKNWANLMINNQFRCDGMLTQVEYYRGTAMGIAYAGVWRQVEDKTFLLKHRIPLLPASVGVHRVVLPEDLPVSRGDFLGVHYSKELPSGVVLSTDADDNIVAQNELYYTHHYEIFDEDIVRNQQYNLDAFNGGMLRKTLALRAFVDYPGSPGNNNNSVCS